MFYYRYRSGSELSIKELIYDELYFASSAECNDPYEGKIFAILEKNQELWNNLIRLALKFYANDVTEYLIKRIITFYVGKAPIYFDQFVNTSEDEFLNLGNDEIEKRLLKNMLESIKQYAFVYMPAEQYFASFSRKSDNFLMWSHYANNHSGFCLVFRSIDGKIRQSKKWKKSQLSYTTPHSFSPKMSFAIPDSFEIKDVEYVITPKCLNGFLCFPASVVRDKYTPTEIEEFLTDRDKIYWQKHSVWDYEEESRVVLSSGIPWLAGERLSLSPHQRLFHYESTQLVGIIIGTKMSKEQRYKIEQIISEKVSRWYIDSEGERIISDFVLFEEQLSETNREVEIIPYKIYGGVKPISINDKNFEKHFEDWKAGRAIKFVDNKAEKIQLL